MAINPINIVTMTRTQDYTTIKHNEDNRATVMQMNMNEQESKELKIRSQQVVKKEETGWNQKKFDAKDKSDNEYAGDGGKNRRGHQTDKMVKKGQQGFDVKI